MNVYLEKIAEFSQDDLDYVTGKHLGIKKYLTGGFGINSRLRERGYDSDIHKVVETAQRAQGPLSQQAKSVGKHLLLPVAVGGLLGNAGGRLAAKYSRTQSTPRVQEAIDSLYRVGGTAAGMYTGLVGGAIADSRENFNSRLPAQFKREMISGHYSKSK